MSASTNGNGNGHMPKGLATTLQTITIAAAAFGGTYLNASGLESRVAAIERSVDRLADKFDLMMNRSLAHSGQSSAGGPP